MSEQKHTIHIRIRDLRREKALTQEELAEALGISRQSINAMEAGRCLPSLPVAFQIASFFSVPVQTVFGIEEALAETRAVSEAINQTANQSAMSQLVPWSPLREMREALDELMDESTGWAPQAPTAAPAANIYEDGNALMVEMRLPGYNQEDLSIEVGEDFITIQGNHREASVEDDKRYFRREFAHQSFQRTLALPAKVEGNRAEAEMKQGMLSIRIPKYTEEKPKTAKISIKTVE